MREPKCVHKRDRFFRAQWTPISKAAVRERLEALSLPLELPGDKSKGAPCIMQRYDIALTCNDTYVTHMSHGWHTFYI